MNAFPVLAALTLGVCFAILRASFDDLREAPLALDAGQNQALRDARDAIARRLVLASRPHGEDKSPVTIYEANEGLLDHELAGDDPIEAWLSRYLTPAAD